jgi:hypothetical protein
MKVWPPGKQEHGRLHLRAMRRARGHEVTDLSDWVLTEEKRLVETRFAGNWSGYARWRDRLWRELQDSLRKPDSHAGPTDDDEYVVMTAFGGDWAQYRVCRDRLREELWQIMKMSRPASSTGSRHG